MRLPAYVLMDNHFHLLIETPEGNLSRARQWLPGACARRSKGTCGEQGQLKKLTQAVGQAVSRFGKRLMKEAKLRGVVQKIESEIVKC